MKDYKPFDLSAMTVGQAHIITAALDATDFNFPALIPGLVAQVRRDTIPVLFSDLSRWRVRGHGSNIDGEAHTIERMIDGRWQVFGLAWYSGKVEIEKSLETRPELAQEVFLAEGAHMVDFFLMTPEQREKIFAIYHEGSTETHDHGWFEETGNNNYWSWVGESFMYGFIAAFSSIQGTNDSFIHKTTPEIGQKIKQVFSKEKQFIRRNGSSIIHRLGGWHEKQIPDIFQQSFETLTEAQLAGFRKCKTCRWSSI